MRTFSLSEALSQVLDARVKHAQIALNPKAFFIHVRVPEHVSADLRDVQKRAIPDVSKHEDIDHVTLVYTKKALEDHPPEKVHAALSALRTLGERTKPIDARIQGWGYFDGASNGGKPSTALVALLDAPGLEYLHVDMVRALKDHGIEASDLHVFTPHITLGYLGHEGRVDKLEPLSGKFTIDKAHVAARDHHEIPLTGHESVGQKAAEVAWKDHVSGGLADKKTPADFPAAALAQGRKVEQEHTDNRTIATEIAMDHLSEDLRYYDKLKEVEKDSKKAGVGFRAALYALGGCDG